MPKLQIAKNLSIPLEAVTETFALLGKRGGGKSYCASVLVEQMLENRLQVVILDPMGIWYGLRTLADGKSAGFQIPVLGGEHGDIPLDSHSGKVVADLVMGDGISAVLDVSLFSKGERKRFVADFAERLYRKNREAMHLVLEEADMFAPQKPQQGEQRMLGAIEDLVRRGRSRGIGISLISQRSAVLNKDVLTQTECLIALRTTAPHDRKAIKDWIDAHADRDEQKRVMDSLPGLPTGTAWFWSPAWLEVLQKVKVNKKKTLDTGATPKAGRRRLVQKTVAEVDLGSITDKMSATIEKAANENPAKLRARIRQLEKQAAKPSKSAPAPNPLSAGEVDKQIKAAIVKNNASWAEKFKIIKDAFGQRVRAHARDSAQQLSAIADAIEKEHVDPPIMKDPEVVVPDNPKAADNLRPPPKPASTNGSANIGNSERRILNAIAWMNAVGIEEPNQTAVSFLAGYKSVGSGGYKNPRSRLRVLGMVEYRGQQIALTDAGRAIAEPPDIEPTNEALQSAVLGRLKGPEAKLLRYLLNAHPQEMSNSELAEVAGYDPTSGGFKNPRSRLRTLGLVDYVAGGETRANDFLFPEGL